LDEKPPGIKKLRKRKYYMNRLIIRIVIILLVLAIASLACVNGGDGSTSNGSSATGSSSAVTSGPDATATYGAEQFHLQLTASAQQIP
jgi:hypothetical protein